MGFFSSLLDQPFYIIAVELIGLFAVVARFTPNKSDDKVAQFLLSLINQLGMNVGPKSKNQE